MNSFYINFLENNFKIFCFLSVFFLHWLTDLKSNSFLPSFFLPNHQQLHFRYFITFICCTCFSLYFPLPKNLINQNPGFVFFSHLLHYTHWRKWKKSPLTTALPYSIIIILNFPHHFLLRKDLQWTMKVIKTIFSFSYNNFITLHCNILSSIQPTIKKSGNNNRERQLINTQYFVS